LNSQQLRGMAYLLENQAVDHSNNILETLQNWSEQESDVHLISNQGAVLQTHRVYLKLYSSVLNSALQDFSSDTIPSIFIPATTASLVNLIRILSTGVSISDQKEDLLDVVNTAELLGIFLKGIQVGTRDTPTVAVSEENKVEQTELPNTDIDVKRKKSKKRKHKEKHLVDNVEVKKECEEDNIEISSYVSEEVSIKDEHNPDSDQSLSMQLNSTDNEVNVTTTCPECGKTFAKRDKLKRHLLIHTDVKPFSCDECESQFKRKDKLDFHKHVKHSSIEPVACSECGKSFSQIDKLKRHSVIHTDEKPFPCDECESKFNRKDTLDHHKNVKHNENYVKKGHVCSICKKAYGSSGYLNKHMESVHNSEQI